MRLFQGTGGVLEIFGRLLGERADALTRVAVASPDAVLPSFGEAALRSKAPTPANLGNAPCRRITVGPKTCQPPGQRLARLRQPRARHDIVAMNHLARNPVLPRARRPAPPRQQHPLRPLVPGGGPAVLRRLRPDPQRRRRHAPPRGRTQSPRQGPPDPDRATARRCRFPGEGGSDVAELEPHAREAQIRVDRISAPVGTVA